jgi:hypothetical protein
MKANEISHAIYCEFHTDLGASGAALELVIRGASLETPGCHQFPPGSKPCPQVVTRCNASECHA